MLTTEMAQTQQEIAQLLHDLDIADRLTIILAEPMRQFA